VEVRGLVHAISVGDDQPCGEHYWEVLAKTLRSRARTAGAAGATGLREAGRRPAGTVSAFRLMLDCSLMAPWVDLGGLGWGSSAAHPELTHSEYDDALPHIPAPLALHALWAAHDCMKPPGWRVHGSTRHGRSGPAGDRARGGGVLARRSTGQTRRCGGTQRGSAGRAAETRMRGMLASACCGRTQRGVQIAAGANQILNPQLASWVSCSQPVFSCCVGTKHGPWQPLIG